MNQLIAFRAFQGIGGAGLFAIPQAISCDVVSLKERPRYQMIFELVMSVGNGCAPLLGGFLVSKANWQWCFLFNLIVGPFVFALCLWQIPSTQSIVAPGATFVEKIKQVDFVGIALIAAATTLVLYAANAGGIAMPWSSPPIIACLTVGSVALLAFIAYEIKVPAVPVIPMHLFKLRNVVAVYTQQFLFGIAFFQVLFLMPLYLQLVHGSSPLESGAVLIAYIFPICPGVFFSLLALQRTGRYRTMIWASSAVYTIGLGLLSTLNENTSMVKVVGFLFLGGIGMGPGLQTGIVACQASVKRVDMPVVGGGRLFVRIIGSALGVVVGLALV